LSVLFGNKSTDKLEFNWQNLARVRLQLKFAFVIRSREGIFIHRVKLLLIYHVIHRVTFTLSL